MATRPTIGVRVSQGIPERLDAIAAALPRPPGAAPLGRSDAARAALEEGVALLERTYSIKPEGAEAAPTKTGPKVKRR